MKIRGFQKLIKKTYYKRDKKRTLPRTFVWFIEEVGEMAKVIRQKEKAKYDEEFADVFAWLVGLANLLNIDLEKSIGRYRRGCPKCKKIPCACKYDKASFTI